MIAIFYKAYNKIVHEIDVNRLNEIDYEDLLWVDLAFPSPDEKQMVEDFFEVNLQTRQQAEEIESSSRYFETENLITANSNFLIQTEEHFITEPVSFILKDGILISLRNMELRAFADTIKKFYINYKAYPTGYHVLIALFETRIDLDADMVENVAKEVAVLSRRLSVTDDLDEELILNINKFQENTMLIRENIIDKQRVISGILKSERFPTDTYPKLSIMIKDVGSLINHTDFSFERLEYLQNTFLGLINIEQNKIIKIFTVASVVFMPPTLIASIYGMNYKFMPELQWEFGYMFALGLMLFSSMLTLFIFKKKNWL
ncbi:MAG TPA: magnesium/cobalt transporter CorA [Tenuifilaceae bacterium]|nr:magnesium/cobalt transporter CorA [Tenuifilaceae bacterium]HPE19252.1 magnesium/cobalt transporter CorA [Tenuifilaceae bacterium]HPJ47186.1 magnesium/cobalt transporter CorA [Tenuifilaceae bacterium]HPQ35818.1 magnesium/cobalt transporter CorA [Tenuifilaceae bacterium]HRX69441.1 magnesium/cobalt transporter CorA [Tenuifilaceae bacterium]